MKQDPDCLFCRIIAGDIPSDKVYEDQHVLAIRDIHPVAPFHVLVIPKSHSANFMEMTAAEPDMAQHLLAAIQNIVEQEKLHKGYRLITNIGAEGGQSVFHTHVHLIAGPKLTTEGL